MLSPSDALPIGSSYVASAADASGHDVVVDDLLVAGDGEGDPPPVVDRRLTVSYRRIFRATGRG